MASDQIDPEVADRLRLLAREPARERDGDRDAGSRGREVLHRERRHLREVAHRRLADVRLPVRVGQEADRRVEGEVRRERRGVGRRVRRAEAHRVQREPALEPHDPVHEQELGDVERQHRARVGRPVLLDVLPDAGQLVEQDLERSQHRMEEGTLAFEDARHEHPHRLGEREDDEEVEQDLVDAKGRHDRLRTFPVEATRRRGTRTTPRPRDPK